MAGSACSASDKSSGTGAANGTGASDNTGAGGGFIFTGDGGDGGSGTGGGCASDTRQAEKIPLDMYMMLDQSGSMSDAVQGGTKWSAVSGAIGAFVQQPPAVGMGVALQYFPIDSAGCPSTCSSDPDCGACGPCFVVFPGFPGVCLNGGGDSCNAADYAAPEVAMQTLPGAGNAAVNAVLSSLAQHGPTGSTPTSAALQGAVDYAKSWAGAHVDHVTIVVLATDGDPTECDTDLGHIDNIAAAAANSSPAVLTFVIGVGSSLTALNQLAAAGGTGQAFLVDTGQNVNQQFLDALNVIQGQALGCNYTIPQPAEGQLDYDKVNVSYTPGGSNVAETFPKVSGPGDCPPSGDGWYYDDNLAPTQIILCNGTCTKVAADSTGKIEIVLGCDSVLN